jgi:hypothetical protein
MQATTSYPAFFVNHGDHGTEHFAEAGSYSGDLNDLDQVGRAFGLDLHNHDADPFTGEHVYHDADGVAVLKIETAD